MTTTTTPRDARLESLRSLLVRTADPADRLLLEYQISQLEAPSDAAYIAMMKATDEPYEPDDEPSGIRVANPYQHTGFECGAL
jgi:hypothetical protein